MDSHQTHLGVSFQFIDYFEQAHLPSVGLDLDVLFVFGPEEDVDGLLDDLADLWISAHLLNELEVKTIAFHLGSEVPHETSIGYLYLSFEVVVTDEDFVEGVELFDNELVIIEGRLADQFIQDLILDGLINLLYVLLLLPPTLLQELR